MSGHDGVEPGEQGPGNTKTRLSAGSNTPVAVSMTTSSDAVPPQDPSSSDLLVHLVRGSSRGTDEGGAGRSTALRTPFT